MPILYNFANKKGVFMIPSGGTKSPTPTPPSFNNTKSLNFDGVDDSIGIGTTSLGITTAISVSAWVKTTATGAYKVIACEDTTSGVGRNWNLLLGSNDKVGWFIWNTDGTQNYIYRATANEITDGNWHHILATYDGTTDADGIKLYVDGNLESATAGSTGIRSTATSEPYIGSVTNGTNWFFEGNIDEVSIWNTNINIDSVWDGTGKPTDLTSLSPVAWYRNGDNSTYKLPQILMPENSNKNNVSNYSLSMDGVDDYIDTGTSALDGASTLTISVWFNTSYDTWQYMLGDNSIRVFLKQDANRVDFSFNGSVDYRTTNFNITLGTWNHLAIVFDGSLIQADRLKLYLNNSLLTNNLSGTSDTTFVASNNFMLGRVGSSSSSEWNGNLDEVAVWNSVQDISSIYNSGTPTTITGATAYWKLGEEAKFTDNWLVPNSALSNYSKFSFAFDGVDDVVLCQSDLAGDLNQINGAISVSCWVKTTQGAVYEVVVSRDAFGGPDRDWSLLKDNFYPTATPGGAPLWQVFNTNGVTLQARLTSANDPQGNPIIPINDGNWHHIVGVYDGSDTAYLYTDGILQGTNTIVGFGSFPLRTTRRVCIGGANNGSLPTALVASWVGGVDEVAIWNTALSGTDVLSIYNSGTPLIISGALSHWQMGDDASFNTNWTIPDQIGSNDAESTNMTIRDLKGDAPNYSGSGISNAMTIEDRVGDAPNSENNAVSYNMESTDIENNTP